MKFLILAAVDLVIFGGWIAQNEWAQRAGVEVILPVEGYDPRDLLSGHYVRFRLVAVAQANALGITEDGETRFCIEPNALGRWNVTRVAGKTCAKVLVGTVKKGRVDFGVDRFFVDERRQNEVVGFRADDSTFLRARLGSDGHLQIVDLVVSGRSLSGR
ncbi:MAG: GDYXXLXY domain-containing protein [Deltaproteobacteria bacterium]|nr:GDYXXLXY domain-containing protein [Deltaproteobacteria bacterium]